MENISFKGIALGLLAIVIIDFIGGIAGIPLFSLDMSVESINAMSQDQGFLLWSLCVGTLSTILGGFIAAKKGKLAPYKNSGIIGGIGVGLGILLGGETPLWFDIIGVITVVPAALIGGFLVARKNV